MTHRWCLLLLVALVAPSAPAEEVWLHDNTRLYGLVRGVTDAGRVVVQLPAGSEEEVALEDVVAIRFLGRNPLLVRSGTQEFRFLDGSRLRGEIHGDRGDRVRTETALAGTVEINLAHLKGFVSMPLTGLAGRKAEELVEGDRGGRSPALDMVLDRRGSVYPGVVRRLSRTDLVLDHEDLLQTVPVKMLYLAGVRLADAGRAEYRRAGGTVQIRVQGRDDSVVQGTLRKIRLGRWHVSPAWDPEATLAISVEEIVRVQVLGGRVQYLSQLEPAEVKEGTLLAPPQPYRMDQSCHGDVIAIGNKRYPWGIGVHADSELTFALDGGFKEFRSDVGVAARMGERGSVVFAVLGDGKELFKSKVVTGAGPGPVEVKVSVAGVKRLTLRVTNGGDLDLGDAANWGSARVLR